MKRTVVSQCEQGSAEEVVAHAAWQRSRGRNPSMAFVGQNNPRKALAMAKGVIQMAKHTALGNSIGKVVVRYKKYHEMSDLEIEVAARHIISSSSSEEEVQRRFRDELGYPYPVDLNTSIPDDEVGRQARELVRGLGGLVMQNGAMAQAIIDGHEGYIML